MQPFAARYLSRRARTEEVVAAARGKGFYHACIVLSMDQFPISKGAIVDLAVTKIFFDAPSINDQKSSRFRSSKEFRRSQRNTD